MRRDWRADMLPHMTRGGKRPTVAIASSQGALRVPRKKMAELIAYVAAAEHARIADVDVAVVGAEEMAALMNDPEAYAKAMMANSMGTIWPEPGSLIDAGLKMFAEDEAKRSGCLAVTDEESVEGAAT